MLGGNVVHETPDAGAAGSVRPVLGRSQPQASQTACWSRAFCRCQDSCV